MSIIINMDWIYFGRKLFVNQKTGDHDPDLLNVERAL